MVCPERPCREASRVSTTRSQFVRSVRMRPMISSICSAEYFAGLFIALMMVLPRHRYY